MTGPDRQPASEKLNRVLRWTSWGFGALFALSAALQLNDPDWAPWFLFYLGAAIISGAAPTSRRGRAAALLWLILSGVWAGAIALQGLEPITMAELFGDRLMKTLNVERWRELGGLLIATFWMAVLVVASKTPSPGKTIPSTQP
jgi:hypothetical protein